MNNTPTEESLKQLLARKKRLSLDEALSIQTDILESLKPVHESFNKSSWKSKCQKHLNLLPDHIIISHKNDRLRARIERHENQVSENTAIEALNYVALECFWDVCLPASDIFSSGVIFYRMISGEFPWKYDFDNLSGSLEDIISRIYEVRKTPPPGPSFYNENCSRYLDSVILKAVSTGLEYRYSSAAEFLFALKAENRLIEIKPGTEKYLTPLAEKDLPEKPAPSEEKKKSKGFEDVAGMQDIKEILFHDIILPLRDKAIYEAYKVTVPNGMLLYGPPGCGKTFISQKFAEEVSYYFIQVKPSDLASIYVHGTQEKIGQLFKQAREKSPTIIFIDEVDAILPSRQGNLYHSYASEVNEFLAQMTECHEQGIFIIAATNRPERIDPAILRTGRIDRVIYVPPPDPDAREEMFRLYLKDRPADNDIDLKKLAELSENYVSSDIRFMVNEASRAALKQRVKITQKHVEDIIKITSPSVSENQIRQYEAFKNARVFV